MVANQVSKGISAENQPTPYQPSNEEVKQALATSTLHSLPVATLTLSGLYLLLTAAHFTLLPPDQKAVLVPAAAISCAAFFIMWVALGQKLIPVSMAQGVAGLIGLIALANSLIHLWVSGDLLQTTNLMLVVLVVSAFYLSTTWFWVLSASGIAGWILLQVGQPTSDMTVHFGIAMFMTFVASVLVNRVRMAAYTRLHRLRIQSDLHQETLQSHQEQLEERVQMRTQELGETNRTLQAEIDRRGAIETALKKSERELKQQQTLLSKTVKDQTIELRNANQALKETADLKSQFMADISQDIQDPLYDILSKVDLMQQGLSGDVSPRQMTLLSELEQQANKILDVVSNVRNVSRLDNAEIKRRSKSIDVARVLEARIETARPAANARNLSVVTRFDPDATHITVDEKRLTHILNTFFNNVIMTAEAGTDIGVAYRGDVDAKQMAFYVWNSSYDASNEAALERGLLTARQLAQLQGGSLEQTQHAEGGIVYVLTLPWRRVGGRVNSAEKVLTPIPTTIPSSIRRKLKGQS